MNCTWIGEGELCTGSTVPDRSYCEQHVWIIYQQGTRLGKRNRDQERVSRQRLLSQLLDEAVTELEAEGII